MQYARAERGDFAGVANLLCPDVIPKIKSGVGLMDLEHPGRGLAELKDPAARGRYIAFNRAMDTKHRAAMDAYLVDSLDQVAACFRDMCAGFTYNKDEYTGLASYWPCTGDVPKLKAQLANICALSEERFGSRNAFCMCAWLEYLKDHPELHIFQFDEEWECEGPYPHEMDALLQGLDTPTKMLFVASTVMSKRCMLCATPSRLELPSDRSRLGAGIVWVRCSIHYPRLMCEGCIESQAVADSAADLELDPRPIHPRNINYNCAYIMAKTAGTSLEYTLACNEGAFVSLFKHPVLGGSLQEELELDDSEVGACKAQALEQYAESMFNSTADRLRREAERRLRDCA